MLTNITNPCNYFANEHLVESEIVRFLVRPHLSRCDLVFIHTAPVIGKYFAHLRAGNSMESFRVDMLEFRWLRFVGVQQVNTRLGPNVPAKLRPQGTTEADWLAHERALLTPRGRLITGVKCLPSAAGFRCAIDLDSFGEHSWSFASMIEARRTVRVIRQGVDAVYQEVATDLVVDRSDPFRVEMMEG
jgi:hypothetical protein